MSDTSRRAPQPDVAEIREDIERTRRDLGDTVEALAHKADVPARAKEKANEVLDTTKTKAEQAMHVAQVKAAELSEQAQQAIDKLPPPAAQRAKRVMAAAQQRPGAFVVGAIVSIALVRRVVRRRRQN